MEKYGISFKEMNVKQKVAHIWTYYRYHIVAVIIATAMIFFLGKAVFFPEPSNSVDIMFCGPIDIGDNEMQVINEFKKKYSAGLNLYAMDWDKDTQMATVMTRKIPLTVGVDSLEILALPEEQFKSYAVNYGTSLLTPLDEVPELSDFLKEHADQLYTSDEMMDDDGNLIKTEKHVYGIKTNQFPGIKSIRQSGEMVIGLTSVLRERNKAICMYQYILGDESAIEHYYDEDWSGSDVSN